MRNYDRAPSDVVDVAKALERTGQDVNTRVRGSDGNNYDVTRTVERPTLLAALGVVASVGLYDADKMRSRETTITKVR